MNIKDVSEGMPDACAYCLMTHEKGGGIIELRPYGKDGAWICFDCGMKPENKETTDAAFATILSENDVIVVSERQGKSKLN